MPNKSAEKPKFHDDIFKVQILNPPFFEPSGVIVDRRVAWEKREWIPTFNLWIVQNNPLPSVLYQMRSPNIGWAPGKLDVAVAGHYEDLEGIEGGLREASEELDKKYQVTDLIPLGRRLNVGVGQDNSRRQTVSDLFLAIDNSPLESFNIQKKELFAICSIPLVELLKVHENPGYSFIVKGLRHDKQEIQIDVQSDKFPPNWDPYHYKMALLIKRFFDGDKNLIY